MNPTELRPRDGLWIANGLSAEFRLVRPHNNAPEVYLVETPSGQHYAPGAELKWEVARKSVVIDAKNAPINAWLREDGSVAFLGTDPLVSQTGNLLTWEITQKVQEQADEMGAPRRLVRFAAAETLVVVTPRAKG